MIRGKLGLVLLLGLGLGFGCGGDDGPGDVDAGTGGADAGGGVDAGGVDAGGGEPDAGVELDAGGGDAGGMDAGSSDAGPFLPDYDAGNPFGDAGELGPPEWAELTILTDGTRCTPLARCAESVLGTWDVSGGCVEVEVPEQLAMLCPSAEVSATGRARGRVTFALDRATRSAQVEVVSTLRIPPACALLSCAAFQSQIRMQAPDSRCVDSPAGGCDCQIRNVSVIDDDTLYTTADGQIIAGAKRWNYCVDGDELRYEDVSESGEREPGIIELTRRGE